MRMKWLVSFDTKIAGIETDTHLLIRGDSLDIVEQGVKFMGSTWWTELQQEQDGHWWCFEEGEVWFSAIVRLDDVEFTILQGLKFLSLWHVSGTPESLKVEDEFGHSWRDYTR